MNQSDDASLWLAATTGTAEAFAVLFDRHRAAVFRKALARTGNPADAEDVVATVFFEAWRKRKKVRIVDGSLRPWLLATATYVCLNHARMIRRHRGALHRLPRYEAQTDHADSVADAIEGADRAARLAAAVRNLVPNEQMLIELSIVEELTPTQISALMDIPIGTVKSRLHRARAKLVKELRGDLHVDLGPALGGGS